MRGFHRGRRREFQNSNVKCGQAGQKILMFNSSIDSYPVSNAIHADQELLPASIYDEERGLRPYPIQSYSYEPDIWWGGMDRYVYLGMEDYPEYVDITKLTRELKDHTGLVFVTKEFKPYYACLYINGRFSRIVMLFYEGLRVEIGKDGRVSGYYTYLPSITEFFKRATLEQLPVDFVKEQRGNFYARSELFYLQQCLIHYLFDLSDPYDYFSIVITLLAAVCFLIHYIFAFTCYWEISVVCLLITLFYLYKCTLSQPVSITYSFLSIIMSLIGYSYYTDSPMFRFFRLLFLSIYVAMIIITTFDERIKAMAILYNIYSLLISCLL